MQVLDDDLHGGNGHQRSNIVNNDQWLVNLVSRIATTYKLSMMMMMMTFMEVKGQQRSNIVNNYQWPLNLEESHRWGALNFCFW